MKTVHKKSVPLGESFRLPFNARPILFDSDGHRDLCVWYEVLPENVDEEGDILYEVFGTGHQIPDDQVWIASCVHKAGIAGTFVWHLYREMVMNP
ncbi:MAG: hypothetical protein QNJ81_02130 [Acidimicrobiia bacterium]|nr:hypothetical protein [Acidimicrobiia bacterium]